MGLRASDLLGTSQVGVHLAMVGRVLFAPMQLSKKDLAGLEDFLGLEVAQMSVGGSSLVGALIAGNSNGIAVADIATEEEIDRLTSYGDVVVMESGVNAAGNQDTTGKATTAGTADTAATAATATGIAATANTPISSSARLSTSRTLP